MRTVVVVDQPRQMAVAIPGVEVVAARAYLTDRSWATERRCTVFNLCRSYRYQSIGYYVSLLAEARGHRVFPDVATVQGMRSLSVVRAATGDLDETMQRSLRGIKADRFELSIYFGRNLAKQHERLARALFNLFPAPLLRATFTRAQDNGSSNRERSSARDDETWMLRRLRPIPLGEVPAGHHQFLVEAAGEFFRARKGNGRRRAYRYELAILVDPDEAETPSDDKAIERFGAAARRAGMRPTVIERDDYGRLEAFDALLIRTTTYVDHYTFRFAQRARTLGLAVIDDPDSIIRCTNKVYLAELLERGGVPTPPTMIVHRDNAREVAERMGLPTVLKKPDSGFSQGVTIARDDADLEQQLARLLADSDLVVAQGFTPTSFDWRIGILDRQPLFACRYHMVDGHWQIIAHDEAGAVTGVGGWDTIAIGDVPPKVLKTALKAANLIGDGLYGVDLKEVDGQVSVIEVNDNPNIESEVEDRVLGLGLYDRVIHSLLRRIEEHRSSSRP